MNANKPDTTASRPGSDLERVDAYRNTSADYDEIPELDDDFFARAEPRVGGQPVRRGGRPRKENPQAPIKLRLDPEVVEHFRSTGAGWQSRINAALVDAIKRKRA